MSWDSPCRSGSFEAGLRSPAPPPLTVSPKDSKPSPRLHRSRSTAATSKPPPSPPPDRRRDGAMRQKVSEMEEELRKEKDAAEKVQLLQREVEKAKESERKMLESLIYQTKQLEQTKISLEEAKLEMHHCGSKPTRACEASAAAAVVGVLEETHQVLEVINVDVNDDDDDDA
ncbi:hypothetical protein OsI_16103 [Oryza sativa Indica Group]|uniref:Uncharacterized protein n=1 Tax=Oryza sativa subsp. indica TaxID=39946 RepID=B8AUE8_ORYSI|nr:hypothetical protein OsI_16103 [Oryza sativa Indica Group]